MKTVIESTAHGAGFLIVDMVADLLGDGGTVFAKDSSNALERSALIKLGLDGDSVFKDQMFVFIHVEFLHSMK